MIDEILKETPDTKACRLGPGVTAQAASRKSHDGGVGMTRRELILSGAAAAVLPGCRLLSHGEDYSVSLLGDVHYDCPPIDVFHSEFRRLHTDDGMFAKYRTEFESLSSMWGKDDRSPSLVKTSGARRLADTAFARSSAISASTVFRPTIRA